MRKVAYMIRSFILYRGLYLLYRERVISSRLSQYNKRTLLFGLVFLLSVIGSKHLVERAASDTRVIQ